MIRYTKRLKIKKFKTSNDLKNKFGADKLTVRTGIKATIDFVNSILEADSKKYSIDPVGAAAQELVITGGLENWVKSNI